MLRTILCAALAAAGFAAQAQTWPNKPVTFLNPFPAGGGTDTFARPIAAKLGQQMGHQFLIENQGGAGGTVGAANVSKRAPDGYNWLFGAVHHTIAESLYARLPYSLEKDFEASKRKVYQGVLDVYLQKSLSISPGSTLGIPHATEVMLHMKGIEN